jgi:hypothetical protein
MVSMTSSRLQPNTLSGSSPSKRRESLVGQKGGVAVVSNQELAYRPFAAVGSEPDCDNAPGLTEKATLKPYTYSVFETFRPKAT